MTTSRSEILQAARQMKGIPVNPGDAFFFSNYFKFILCNIKQIVVFNGANIIASAYLLTLRTGNPAL